MAAGSSPVAIDTNILFSSLLREKSRFSEIILRSEHAFYVCESVLVELFRNKERILRSSRLDEANLTSLYHLLLRRLHLFKEEQIAPEHWSLAYALCREVDETDTPHVALTLQIGGALWTGDRTLREGLEAQGFTSFFTPT